MTRIKSSDVMCPLMREIRTCGLSLGGISPLRRTLSFLILGAVMAISAHGADSLLFHRWSFNNDLTDSIGGQTATATNSSFVAVGSGYAIKTEGGTNGTSYIDLGPNILPNDGKSFTFEIWVRLDTWQNAEYRMFTIGNGPENKFDQTWGGNGRTGSDYTLVTGVKNKYVVGETGIGPLKVGTFHHLAYVFTPSDNGDWTVRAYRHGVGTGILQAKTSFKAATGWKPSTLNQAYSYLARSPSTTHNDSKASFDEVRVWERALSEDEIAASAIAGPDAVIPDGDTPFGMMVFDTASGAITRPAGQTYTDDVEKLSAKTLGLTGDNVFASSLKVYDGTVAQSGGSLSSVAVPIMLGNGLCDMAALMATDGAELNVRGIVGNGIGQVMLDDATLRPQGDSATPTLVHRWSFNGDLSDSVGGQTATWKNASFSNCGNGQAVTLSGGSSGNSYVDLGANALPTDGTGATLELWARNDQTSDSERMFDFGDSINHSVMLCWVAENNVNTDYMIVRYAPKAQVLTMNELAPYTCGKMFHIAMTYTPNGDGTWTVRAYKQDAATGATLKMTTLTAQSGWSLANLVQTHCYLGQGFDSAGSAKATYDEVRIWNGVLTESQLSANAVAGPDAIGGGEVKSSAAMIGGVTVKVGARGATVDTNGKDVVFAVPLASLKNGPVHRWSFNGDLSDSIGGQDATATGCSFVDVGGGQGIKLSGGNHGTTFVDLGAGIVPTDGNGTTIELWARVDDNSVDCTRMFDFGSGLWHSVMLCWRAGGANTDYAIVRYRTGVQTLTQNKLSPYVEGTMYHIAMTILPSESGEWMVRGYKQDAATGETLASTAFKAPSGWTLSSFVQTSAYLGRTFDGDNTKDANATYDEVRIYGRALSEVELTASAVAGPDADLSGGTLVKTGEGSLVLGGTNTLSCPLRVEAGMLKVAVDEALSTNSVVELCAGTALDLGGCAATAGGLTGGGAIVRNGTLSVTGAICPTGEIVLDGVDVSGTLEVKFGSGLLRRTNGAMDLSGVVLDVNGVSPDGQTIIECADGFTGDFEEINNLPGSLMVCKGATAVRIIRKGLIITIN